MSDQRGEAERTAGRPGPETGKGGAEPTDPEEDLAMIRRLMSESRKLTDAGGPFYLLWGVLVMAGLVTTYLVALGLLDVSPGLVWAAAVGLGWVGSFVLGWRQDRRLPVRTTGGRLMTGIWLGGGVTMTLLGFVPPALGIVETSGGIMGPIAMVMATCYFATSYVHRSSAMRWMAAGWWLGAVAMLVWSGATSILVMAGLVLLLQIVPGVWLARRGPESGAPAAA